MKNEIQFNNGDWRNATGHIDYNMTNDYMFRVVLQENNIVLKGLISSMMHIPFEKIESVEVLNPIIPGEYIDDKSYVLDILVRLNNSSMINLEMQMANQNNWTNRSLSYLCRTFNNVQKGADYNSSEPVTQIGFLDYDLFPEDKEFYSKYMLLNVKNHRIYNDKFVLRVLSLISIDEATEEDKAWHIDEWARLFKTTTWEELKMIAEKNDVYAEVANSMYKQNSDLTIRQMCEAREEARIHEECVKKEFELLHNQLKEKDAQLEEKDAFIKELLAELEKAKS